MHGSPILFPLIVKQSIIRIIFDLYILVNRDLDCIWIKKQIYLQLDYLFAFYTFLVRQVLEGW